jgi:hypothetical protein
MLAESMGSMIFYLIMLAGVGVLLISLSTDSDLSTAEQTLSSMRLETKQVYSGSGDYSGLDTDTAVGAGIVPSSMVKSDGSVSNAWHGAVTIATGSDTSTFVISYTGVPKDAAVKFASYQRGSWVDVSINGVSIIGASNIVSAAANNSADTNTIAFTSD